MEGVAGRAVSVGVRLLATVGDEWGAALTADCNPLDTDIAPGRDTLSNQSPDKVRAQEGSRAAEAAGAAVVSVRRSWSQGGDTAPSLADRGPHIVGAVRQGPSRRSLWGEDIAPALAALGRHTAKGGPLRRALWRAERKRSPSQ